MRIPCIVLLALTFFSLESFGQGQRQTSAEVRAVWVTTASGLDWPKTTEKEEQRSSLLEIVRTLKRHNFNTIFFQVRARGDSYYQSSSEPWAGNLTGVPGQAPGYDPLAEVLREAHGLGMEVHAWFNLYKVGISGSSSQNDRRHVARSHPDWVYRYDDELWLNPGIPEVNNYLVRVALDLIRHYEVDGIQFDFIRYPGMKVPDRGEYIKYGREAELADWRRGNINRFVEAFHDSVALVRPGLKVGATPVGNFNGSLPSGYSEFYQDALSWVANGYMDYLAPQIYWDLGNSEGDPDFAALARRWVSGASGKHVYAGIAPYKPEVLKELTEQIDSARAAGCQGQAFFRLESLGEFSALGNSYTERALIPAMPWKNSSISPGPKQLAVTELAPGVYHLEWTGLDDESGNWQQYRIYRSSPGMNGRVLAAVTGINTTFLVDTVGHVDRSGFTYSVTAVDPNKNETQPSPAVGVTLQGWDELQRIVTTPIRFSASVDPADPSRILLAYSLPSTSLVSIMLQQDARGTTNPLLENLVGEVKPPGTYLVGIDRRNFPAGEYYVVLRAGEVTINRRLVLGPM